MSSKPFSLEGKCCLITGASSGIGQETASSIAANGGRVIATGRNIERLQNTLEQLEGEGHQGIQADLLQQSDIAHLVKQCPTLHGVVHCAGGSRVAPIKYTTDKIMRELHAINVEAPVALTRELVKRGTIAAGGSLIFISSLSAKFGWPGFVAYGSSKAALIGVSQSLASELAATRIRCNCLAPGMVKTPMLNGGYSEEQLSTDEQGYPFGYGTPQDIANAILFFLSDASRWITGQTLIMDGGATLQ
ncbi:hypothetical protein BOW53_00395 [Solemya pervernicosa gill symbiont]|uniref:Ketoreductase domain-containing protein n=1 Tax=Solemya pervernicosa gill symbiont TaxID=642797 RepID=A0A1T2LBC9_9GAMM|nr:SDR family oxidoreductase [Solemya pervernicosa gill symbiont]OOZ42334.1 hypothetical protein BOW53_00395 [Solemya pervernicosa gill symbiont]